MADRGSKAIELLEQNKDFIDIIIVDIEMPDMNGRELIRKLKERLKDLKIIVLSGHDKSTALLGIKSLINGFFKNLIH